MATDWLKIADIAANLFSKAAGSSANNRGAKTAANIDRDREGIEAQKAYDTALLQRAQLEMDRKKLDAALQQDALQKAWRSSLVSNFSPMARPSGVPNLGSPNIGAGGLDASKLAERSALLKLMQGGENYTPVPTAQKYNVAPIAEPSTFEKISNILGLGLTGASAFGHLGKGRNPNTPVPFIDIGQGEEDQ